MAEDLPRLSPQSALKMDQWKMAATTHVSASDRFEPRTRHMAGLGPPALDVRLGERSGYLNHTSGTSSSMDRGVATDVVKMAASNILMYYFIRSL